MDVIGQGPNAIAVAAHRRTLRGERVTFDSLFLGRWFASSLEPVWGEDGSVTGVLGVALDITERKQTEERLRTSLEELRRLDR